MPRRARQAPGGFIYHVLNRAAGRRQLFDHDGDYEAFLRVLAEAQERRPEPLPILCFCLMPNHWHLVPRPGRDGELSEFMFWLTMTHTQRWRHFRRSVGEGPLYQGRFKCFPVQAQGREGAGHFLTLCRYVERNALRAGLVDRAQDWRWSSLHARLNPLSAAARLVRLHPWPVEEPSDWLAWVNEPQTDGELERLRSSVRRGRPFGEERWQRRTAAKLGLEPSLRPPGRPKTKRAEAKATAG